MMTQQEYRRRLARKVRNLAGAIAVGVWVAAMPPVSVSADECVHSPDCGGEVCVAGQCVACDQAPNLCDEYSYGQYGNLIDPFCNASSGTCWECSDCLPNGCSPSEMECGSGSGEDGCGEMCPFGSFECCPEWGICSLLFCPI